MHVLFNCFESLQAIQYAGPYHVINTRIQRHNNANVLILDVYATEDANTAGQFTFLIWLIWKNRNNSVWNNEKDSGRGLGVKARQFWSEWHFVQNWQHNTSTVARQQQQTT
jgi:hypothetical protein